MANVAIMANVSSVFDLPSSQMMPTSPASKLKNAFKPVFQQVLSEGAVSITRNNKREAVLLTAELYDQIIAALADRDPLETLRKDYDARFRALQTASAGSAYQDAFNASPEELGQAALNQAND